MLCLLGPLPVARDREFCFRRQTCRAYGPGFRTAGPHRSRPSQISESFKGQLCALPIIHTKLAEITP